MKKHAAIAACFYVAGCGFHPLYGGRLEPQMASVYVEPIEERDGYELRTRLIDLLHTDGRQEGKRYFLKVILNESAQGIALQNDATITRYNNTLDAKYVLSDAQGTTLFTGTQTELASYNVVNSPYATLTAAQDSSKRAAQQMAERIQLDLGVWFRKRGGK
jgi:LPS-assembly lipoprotein